MATILITDFSGDLFAAGVALVSHDMGAGAGDEVPPVINLVSPANGATIGPATNIVVDVGDETGLAKVLLIADFAPLNYAPEVAYDGDDFTGAYDGSTIGVGDDDAIRFFLVRNGGWPSSPTIRVIAIDTGGNEAE